MVDVLVVEDDPAIAVPLARGLAQAGFGTVVVGTGAEALAAPRTDVVLLDLGLPDMDGLDVCRRLRAASDVPIIVVTARGDEIDRVIGLEVGADDYVVKPVGLRELVARIRAVLRRARPTGASAAAQEGEVSTAGDLVVDRRTRRVTVAGTEVPLTPKEFDLLALLAEDPGAVFRRTDIIESVWDRNWYGPTRTLDVHVTALRKKLGDPGWVETVRGIGFRLGAPAP